MSIFGVGFREMLCDLLEDYEPIATSQYMALVSFGSAQDDLYENVDAALKASTLGLSSIDYTKKRYGSRRRGISAQKAASRAYISSYYLAKNYITSALSRLKTEGRELPGPGVFGASIVLERLPISFFSAHLLYRLGHRYEGHAVSRLMLEQIAWAYASYKYNDLGNIQRQSATKAISELKDLDSDVGLLYGFLSDKTHISYDNHFEFLRVEDNKNVIYHAQGLMDEYAEVILRVADLFVIVWEITQYEYLDEFVSLKLTENGPIPKKNRHFLNESRRALKLVKEALK